MQRREAAGNAPGGRADAPEAGCGGGAGSRRRPEGAAGGHGRSEQDSHPRPSDSAAVVSDHWSRPMGAGGPLVGLAGAPWSGRQQLGVPTSCFFIPAPPALFAEGPSLWAVTAASPRGSKGAAASGHPRRVSTAAESRETSLVPGLRASKQARRGSPQSRPTPAAGSQRARQPEGGGCAEKGVLSLGPQHPGAPSPPAPSQPDAGAVHGLAGPLPSDRKGSSGPLAAPVETGSKWCQR